MKAHPAVPECDWFVPRFGVSHVAVIENPPANTTTSHDTDRQRRNKIAELFGSNLTRAAKAHLPKDLIRKKEAQQIRQAIPAHRKRSDLQSNRIDLGIDKVREQMNHA